MPGIQHHPAADRRRIVHHEIHSCDVSDDITAVERISGGWRT